ncbi:hypothetical protein L9F63_002511, partial [Diploptera punctata]
LHPVFGQRTSKQGHAPSQNSNYAGDNVSTWETQMVTNDTTPHPSSPLGLSRHVVSFCVTSSVTTSPQMLSMFLLASHCRAPSGFHSNACLPTVSLLSSEN